MLTPVERVARAAGDMDLLHVVSVLNAELEAFMATGQAGTHAHLGRLEMAQACSDELVRRGYLRGAPADGRHLPVDVQWEDGPGGPIRLSFAIRVF